MSAATSTQLRDFTHCPAAVSNGRLDLALDFAGSIVASDGFEIIDPYFDKLQLLYASHMLVITGAINARITAKQIGDVSTSFAQKGSAQDVDDYLTEYNMLRVKLHGFSGRVG